MVTCIKSYLTDRETDPETDRQRLGASDKRRYDTIRYG